MRITNYELQITENGQEHCARDEKSHPGAPGPCSATPARRDDAPPPRRAGTTLRHGGAREEFRSTGYLALAMALSFFQVSGGAAQQNDPACEPAGAAVRAEGDDPPSCSPIAVTLATRRGVYRIGEAPQLDVRLTNVSDEPVVLVGALPCSDLRRQYPHCYFLIEGPKPATANNGRFCRGDDELRKEHFVEIGLGQSLDPFAPPFSSDPEFKAFFSFPGDYRLRFCYSTFENDIRKWDGYRLARALDEWMHGAGKSVWELFQRVPQVSICSNEVVITFEGYLGPNGAVTQDDASNISTTLAPDEVSEQSHCPPISCVLSSEQVAYKVGEYPKLKVEIRNDSRQALYLVKRLEGSERGRYPRCYYEITKPAGAPDPRVFPICGNMADIGITDFVRLDPGEQFSPYHEAAHGSANLWDQFNAPGEYRIRFRYSTFEPEIGPWGGFPSRFDRATDEWLKTEGKPVMDRFAQVPKVSIVSNEITIRYEQAE